MYPLKADVQRKVRTADDNTGQMQSTWVFLKTIDCTISPFVSTSFKAQPTNESYREEYEKIKYIKMKTSDPLSEAVRVTNIRNGLGEVIYREHQLSGQPPTNYNSQGSAALLDPFGNVIQYDTLLVRASDQSDSDV